jgi:hypothetical protein
MKTQCLALAFFAALLLPGCQTIEEAAKEQSQSVCTEAGYGPGSKYHDECARMLEPLAENLEREKRAKQVRDGAAMLAAGLNPPPAPRITCVQQGPVTRCY